MLSEERDVGGGFFAALSFVDDNVTEFDNLSEVSFFLDDAGVVFGASSGKGSVDEREQITMFNLAEVTGLAKFFLNGKVVDRLFFCEEAQNSLEYEPMFGTIKVVGVDNGSDLRNDKSIFHEHGREELLFHFDGFWKFFSIHKNHLM